MAPRWRRASIWIALAVQIAAAAAIPAGATADPTPGTPVSVAAGVPGHGRAWELVTPPDTTSAVMFGVDAVSASGDRAFVITRGALPRAEEGALLSHSFAERGAGGWATTPRRYPDRTAFRELNDELGSGPVAFSPDLSTSLWINTLPLQPGQSVPDVGLYRSLSGGGYDLLADMGTEVAFNKASENLQRSVFSSAGHLLPGDAGRTEGRSIYELDGTTLRQLDLDAGGALLSSCGSRIPEEQNAISRDLERVFISSAGAACPAMSRVYLREGEAITEISASHCTRPDCGPAAEALFAGANPSGSVVFLSTAQQLTNDDEDEVADLYRYEVADGGLSRITSARETEETFASGSAGWARVSDDGSRVYFGYAGKLIEGVGSSNTALYMADDEGLHFIAEAGTRPQVSADGRFAVVATTAQLEAADTDSSEDIYRYDAESKTVARVSGAGSAGNGEFTTTEFGIAAGGHRVFFNSPERLLPADRNELPDLYEWVDGGLGLVSAGAPGFAAELARSLNDRVGVVPDGSTVFFKTTATLVPGDRDGGDTDIYAARIGGGFPEPPQPPGCEGEACRPPPPGRIERSTPRSAAFRAKRIGVAPLGAAELRRIAGTGWIELALELPSPGHLSARARARIGGETKIVAAAGRRAKEAGPLRLRLRLAEQARRRLARGGDLRIRLQLRLTPAKATRTVAFTLEGRR